MYYVRRNGNESSKKAERNFILLANEPASLIFKFDNALAVFADYSFCPKQRLLVTSHRVHKCVRMRAYQWYFFKFAWLINRPSSLVAVSRRCL